MAVGAWDMVGWNSLGLDRGLQSFTPSHATNYISTRPMLVHGMQGFHGFQRSGWGIRLAQKSGVLRAAFLPIEIN